MRFEVLTKEDMNALSRELSRAGIMNRPKEETTAEIEHYFVVRGTYAELVSVASEVPAIGEKIEAVKLAYDELIGDWEPGEVRELNTLFEEPDLAKLSVISALVEAGAVEETDDGFLLKEKVPLDALNIELRFPAEEIGDEVEELEKGLNATLVTEYTLEKRYYVEVLEVERELIEAALDIAEDYATEESYVDAMFDGIARSVLAGRILELAEKYKRKNELIEAVMELEPITIEGKNERVNIYYDEDAIEDFLKVLQTLGYLKVKGNRIWV
ncbi:hypothetical protein TEU_00470 [Thermococcus eurythermalis]|uniref:Uncharacterized protein n=1 Tax=Thermococcus eurythermalis TaxID=1505907 RepID=A0A097QR20_9EURY|nr:hypothetical protein [Thermococcus eurythermalis]AIU68929.1 hypothetical protein TEU_00470 [Thermococcus eurythermalis]